MHTKPHHETTVEPFEQLSLRDTITAGRLTRFLLAGILSTASFSTLGAEAASPATAQTVMTGPTPSQVPGFYDFDLLESNGQVITSNSAALGSIPSDNDAPLVGIANSNSSFFGYDIVAADGGITSFGGPNYGDASNLPLHAPIVGMAATPDGKGYWEVASDGGVFNYGDAAFYGSMGSSVLNAPMVGITATPNGHGYWEVAADGGVFAFGDAQFAGSTGSLKLNAPIVGMEATSDDGYRLVGRDGGVFNFNSSNEGSVPDFKHIDNAIGIIALGPNTEDYAVVASDSWLYAFGQAGQDQWANKYLVDPNLAAGVDIVGATAFAGTIYTQSLVYRQVLAQTS
jgi:hypothetical protein